MNIKQFSNFVSNYKSEETSDKKRSNSKQLASLYYIATKNKDIISSYKNAYGISGEEMKHFIQSHKEGDRNSSQHIGQHFRKVQNLFDYSGRQFLDFIREPIQCLGQWRTVSKERSVLDANYHTVPSLIKKWASVSLRVAEDWWSVNHQRTSIHLGVFGHDSIKNRYGSNVIDTEKSIPIHTDDKYRVQPFYSKNKEEYYYNKQNGMEVPCLWYLNVYRHGLHTVVYKSRPCFVLKVKPYPMKRLQEKELDVYKADIVSSKDGVIELHKNIWLVSHSVKNWSRSDTDQYTIRNGSRVFAPEKVDTLGECLTACNDNLSIAERTMSGRVVGGIAKALDL